LVKSLYESSVKIGTSGYSYPWNKGKPTPFAWYLSQEFKTVEINASFYRFPSRNWVKAWKIAPKDFDFAIKTHRSITHYSRLKGRASELFGRFRNTLRDVEEKISFWLFQMPESFESSNENLESLHDFLSGTQLGNKAVVEFRHPSWWEHQDEIKEDGAVFCSVDAPKLPRNIISMNDVVYLRLHGRKSWYSWIYTEDELKEIVANIQGAKSERKYIFLNNDHGMLPNANYLMNAFS
jgi:uncharacterized protein YecE (DUF72 family)